jgi:Zn-finger nucleic acid-binding protein
MPYGPKSPQRRMMDAADSIEMLTRCARHWLTREELDALAERLKPFLVGAAEVLRESATENQERIDSWRGENESDRIDEVVELELASLREDLE